ncbi:uncharacterized protein A4U43_C01F720 [Asparagus officinalis]|uniref:At2g35280-like TPR domain-containing protein n=1 Tax=Asparagus officinalis TaxID=4686 RepID=A0A5P1FL81_ASPOF|nr:uncharacterized protein LOC109829550 [Asparagus officinalis]ONK78892.1 uncharacterized protein A4U43_C01F720 [Asparagus officinalis]
MNKMKSEHKPRSKVMRKLNRKSSIVSILPQDLLLEVTKQIASKSSTPLRDIRVLRATCKSFYRASKEKLVGRSLAVDKEDMLQWWENNAYFALLRDCADCDNLEANFILGVEEIYNLNQGRSGLQHLQRAMDGGHLAAAYFMAILLFRHAATKYDAMNILNRVSTGDLSSTKSVTPCTKSGNPTVNRCRRETIRVIRKSWKKEFEIEPGVPCKHRNCGRDDGDGVIDPWVKDGESPRVFCSHLCRWTYEYHNFFGQI